MFGGIEETEYSTSTEYSVEYNPPSGFDDFWLQEASAIEFKRNFDPAEDIKFGITSRVEFDYWTEKYTRKGKLLIEGCVDYRFLEEKKDDSLSIYTDLSVCHGGVTTTGIETVGNDIHRKGVLSVDELIEEKDFLQKGSQALDI